MIQDVFRATQKAVDSIIVGINLFFVQFYRKILAILRLKCYSIVTDNLSFTLFWEIFPETTILSIGQEGQKDRWGGKGRKKSRLRRS